jgi:hypothetical protein
MMAVFIIIMLVVLVGAIRMDRRGSRWVAVDNVVALFALTRLVTAVALLIVLMLVIVRVHRSLLKMTPSRCSCGLKARNSELLLRVVTLFVIMKLLALFRMHRHSRRRVLDSSGVLLLALHRTMTTLALLIGFSIVMIVSLHVTCTRSPGGFLGCNRALAVGLVALNVIVMIAMLLRVNQPS